MRPLSHDVTSLSLDFLIYEIGSHSLLQKVVVRIKLGRAHDWFLINIYCMNAEWLKPKGRVLREPLCTVVYWDTETPCTVVCWCTGSPCTVVCWCTGSLCTVLCRDTGSSCIALCRDTGSPCTVLCRDTGSPCTVLCWSMLPSISAFPVLTTPKALVCSTCLFLGCPYSHHSGFQATHVTSQNEELGGGTHRCLLGATRS